MGVILLVEDEAPIREFIGETLREEGYEVMSAYHGVEALALAQSVQPDLVLTDLMMPVMNGAELCRRLKSETATSEVPIIVMSAAGRKHALDCDADEFLGKPFDLDTLLALVVRYVGAPIGPPPE